MVTLTSQDANMLMFWGLIRPLDILCQQKINKKSNFLAKHETTKVSILGTLSFKIM